MLEPWGGCLTGAVAGVVYISLSSLITKLRIDDPLQATTGKDGIIMRSGAFFPTHADFFTEMHFYS